MDDRDCMVETARYYTQFLAEESCGKCTPCREGLRHILAILTDICEGRGEQGDIELLERLSGTVLESSLCALGKSAPNPLLTTIQYFREEYEAHIKEKSCAAGVCPAITTFVVDQEACSGCGLCQKACPINVISGQGRAPRHIDAAACIACGSCRRVCKFAAVSAQRRGEA
jgi:NADH-quinone oxidoreductase subunit F